MPNMPLNKIVALYFDNKILNDAYKAFRIQLLSIPEDASIVFLNTKDILSILGQLKTIDKLFISLTSSNSIFFRFIIAEKNEFKIEFFYDYDKNDKEDVQSVLHYYSDGEKKSSYFGSISSIFSIISEISTQCDEKNGSFKEPTTTVQPIFSRNQNNTISETVNPYQVQQNPEFGYNRQTVFS